MSVPSQASPASVVSARGVVKRYGSTVALAGLDAEIGPGITGLLGSNGAGKTTFISVLLGLRSRDAGDLTVLGHDPATAGHRAAVAHRLRARAPRPSGRARRDRSRPAPRRDAPAAAPCGRAARQRRALAGRARRGALPSGRDDVHRPAATGEARLRDRARPRDRPPRRADRRARPDAADGDARSDPPHRHRVRDAHHRVVPPPRRGGADLRRGRDRRGRRGGARGDARGRSPGPGRAPGRGGRASRRAGVDPDRARASP